MNLQLIENIGGMIRRGGGLSRQPVAIMHDSRVRREDAGARGALLFVEELTGELSNIAQLHQFEALAYLFDMAKLEAKSMLRDIDGRES